MQHDPQVITLVDEGFVPENTPAVKITQLRMQPL